MTPECVGCREWLSGVVEDIGSGRHVLEVGCALGLRDLFTHAVGIETVAVDAIVPRVTPDRVVVDSVDPAVLQRCWAVLAKGGWLLAVRPGLPAVAVGWLRPTPEYWASDAHDVRLAARKGAQ